MNYLPKKENKKFLLEIVFAQSDFDNEQAFKDLIDTTLAEHIAFVEWSMKSNKSNNAYVLSLRGTDKVIDKCHKNLNNLILTKDYKCIRQTDELGDKIRNEAYPIIAEVEQQLRNFINRAMTEIYGVDWWNVLHLETFKPNLQQQFGKKKKKEANILNPLELTQFDDLIKLISYPISYWPDNKLLSVADLIELLKEANGSFDILSAKLEKNVTPISLWDSVFSKYFADKNAWETAKKWLATVIEDRHKVMHHRYVSLGLTNEIEALKTRLKDLFLKAKDELSEQEMGEAKIDIGKWEISKVALDASVNRNQRMESLVKNLITNQAFEASTKQMQELMKSINSSIGSQALEASTKQMQELMKSINSSIGNQAFEASTKQMQELMKSTNSNLSDKVQKAIKSTSKPKLNLPEPNKDNTPKD